MSDLISREYMKSLGATCIASRSKDGTLFPIVAIDELPPADPIHPTPSNTLGALDCVSRQDAIDAVEFGITYAKAIDVNTGESKGLFKEGNDALRKAVERLKELPSAEPRTKYILEVKVDKEDLEELVSEKVGEIKEWLLSAEQKTGKWVKDNYGNTVCSECLGIRRDNRINYINFCNQCGADMRGESE